MPQLKQAENYDSNVFPLTKAESVEDIIYYMGDQTQYVGMGAIQEKYKRARSAHVLGPRSKSLGQKSFGQN